MSRGNMLAVIESGPTLPLSLRLVINSRAPYRRGASITLTLVASGGAGGYVYSIASGSLPAGMSALDTTAGTSTGTLTTVGRYEFVAQVQDAASTIAQHRFAVEVVGVLVPVAVTPVIGEVSVPYNYTLGVTGNTGSVTWTLVSGTLPDGITIGTGGPPPPAWRISFLSGTPTALAEGTSYFTLRATDAGTGDTLDVPMSVEIAPALELKRTLGRVVIGSPFTVGARNAVPLAVTDGTLPWVGGVGDVTVTVDDPGTWDVLVMRQQPSGTLVLSAAPTEQDAAYWYAEITVTDALGATDTATLALVSVLDGKLTALKSGVLQGTSAIAIDFTGTGVTSVTTSAGKTTVQIDSGGGGGSSPLMLDMFSGIDSTIYGSGQKRVVGQRSIDPSAAIYGLGPSSTATLCVLLATTNATSAACAELFQMTGTGSPQIIAATGTTTSLSSALVSADVSAAFTDTSPSGIFAVRVWTANPDGTKQAVCYGAWLEIEP